ncbi:Hvo_1808 family surface protein [Halorubrum vacuolatum]|uniref:PGF-CTERM protein n=1 Tax=Halorubrum vacuolatum TaxID=63740 RepID=A0A238VTF4_HALVU|nr:Hvo_1808 family surface protein [Halorubrum vacuolatum]SNR37595.1 PGF-CTERM protein [Halorubrum vacuolatum]
MGRIRSPSGTLPAVLVFLLVALTALTLSTAGVGAATAPVVDAAECTDGSENELVGCWNGIHHTADPDGDLGIDQADGLSDEELADLTSLKMARVEAIRERPFEAEVAVDVLTREEFADQRTETDRDPEFDRWNDQVWKALFVIGEDESSGEVIDEVFSGAVAGFYSPADDRIVIVVDDDENVQVSPSTLLHELGHAMQDQYDDLSDERFTGETQDADLGIDGAVEGEVVYMEEVYAERCADEWACTPEPSGTGGGGGEENLGVLLTVLQPYSDGAPYVDELIEADGWEAVDDLMADPPETTRETIHREPFEPTPIDLNDTAEEGWERYDEQGVNGSDTVGEASMFVSLWYQSSTYDAGVMAHDDLFPSEDAHPYQTYNYSHPATNGWANDVLYPYRNDEGDEERDGYVWRIEWESGADAERFHEAYLQILDAHDADHRPDGIYEVADGDFRGAYGIERNDTTLTITHALAPDEVFEIRPDLDPTDTPANVEPDDSFDEPIGDDLGGVDPDGSPEADDVGDDAPGFGVLVALAAVLSAATLLARRSRTI